MKANLCKCTNCETIMYDENPQVDAKLYLVRNGKTHLNEEVATMDKDKNDNWACPECETDNYLIDL